MVGYQSKDASEIGKVYAELPTTKEMIKYMNYLRQDPKRMFIFVWGKGKWNDMGFDINDEDCERVNKQCSRNKYIRDEDLIKKIINKLNE